MLLVIIDKKIYTYRCVFFRRCSRDLGYFIVSIFVGSTFAFPAVLVHSKQLTMNGFWYAVSGAACIYITVIVYDYIKPSADSGDYNPVI